MTLSFADTLYKPGREVINSWTKAFFPPKCLACGSLYIADPVRQKAGQSAPLMEQVLSDYVCPPCGRSLTPACSPMCVRCGDLFDAPEGLDHLCQRCAESTGWFTKARAVGIYDGALLSLVHAFKYRAKVQLAVPFGELLWHGFMQHWGFSEVDMILPVPLHAGKLRHRGFNHSFQMIKAWPRIACKYGLDPQQLVIDDQVLMRTRNTPPQTGLKRTERRVNIRNAFEVANPKIVAGKRILLMDDVLTTGATVEECGNILIRSGAERVDVLTLARA
jgi:ComF family protein